MSIGSIGRLTVFGQLSAASSAAAASSTAPVASAGNAPAAAAFDPQSVDTFIDTYLEKLKRAVYFSSGSQDPNIGGILYNIGQIHQHDPGDPRHKATNLQSQLGERLILCWLFSKTLGIPETQLKQITGVTPPNNETTLAYAVTSLKSGSDDYAARRRNYWLPHIALALSSELENPYYEEMLKNILDSANGWPAAQGKEKERLILEQIYRQYLVNVNNKGQEIAEFSLMIGENLFRQALIAKSQGRLSDYGNLFAKAKKTLEKIATTTPIAALEGSGDKSSRIAGLLRNRSAYVPSMMKSIRNPAEKHDEIRKYVASANLMMGKIIMLEGSNKKNASETLAALVSANAYLSNLAPLDGLHRLEAANVTAENHALQAFSKKNLYQDFLADMTEAKRLTRAVLAWETAYDNKTINYQANHHVDVTTAAGDKIKSRWLAQTTASSALWQIKIVLFLTGELRPVTGEKVVSLLGAELGSDNVNLLKARPGADRTKLIEIQKHLLETAGNSLVALKNRHYNYRNNGSTTAVALFRNEALADLQGALAESYGRRVFFANDLGNQAAYTDLVQKAKKELDEIISSATAASLTKKVANLWLAKLLLVDAGLQNTESAEQALVDKAAVKVEAALKNDHLTGSLLSSALQTQGDVLMLQKKLSSAQEKYKQALAADNRNFEALAGLADIELQMSKYDEANENYNKLILAAPDLPVATRARLGLAEAAMRQDENYLPMHIAKLEEATKELFAQEPRGSFLVARAVNALVEAYGTNEDLHEKIVALGTSILQPAAAEALGRFYFKPRFRAQLLLKLAEAYSWLKQYDKAEEILAENGEQAKLIKIIKHKQNEKLNLQYQLLNAEIKMRKTRTPQTNLFNDEFRQRVFASKDPDLISRFVLDLLEGPAYQKQAGFPRIIEIARSYLDPKQLKQIETIFSDKSRTVSFEKFHFKVWQRLANALFWDKQYDQSLQELEALEKKVGSSRHLWLAQTSVMRGNVNLARKDFAAAKTTYEAALEQYQLIEANARSREALTALVEAKIGLGELYRYGDKLQNPENSAEAYQAARAIAEDPKQFPSTSEETRLFLCRIYLGQSKLDQLQLRHNQAFAHIREAAHCVDSIVDPPVEMGNEIDHTYLDLSKIVGPAANFNYRSVRGADGTGETRYQIGAVLPLSLLSPSLKGFQVTALEQIDQGKNSQGEITQLISPYLGVRASLEGIPQTVINLSAQVRADGVRGSGWPMKFMRQPAWLFEGSVQNTYFSIAAALSRENYNPLAGSDFNTYYLGGRLNFPGIKFPWVDYGLLSLAGEYNKFSFSSGQTGFSRRQQFGFGPSVDLDLTGWWRVTANLRQLIFVSENDQLLKYGVDPKWQTGVEIGGSTGVKIGRHVFIDIGVSRQQTAEYPMTNFNAGISIMPF